MASSLSPTSGDPNPTLPKTWFTDKLVASDSADDDGDEVIGVHEERHKNLCKGRGRVRRISFLMPDGYQVNLLAVSDEPVSRLVEVMLGRWIQENGFKHDNERWGINPDASPHFFHGRYRLA